MQYLFHNAAFHIHQEFSNEIIFKWDYSKVRNQGCFGLR